MPSKSKRVHSHFVAKTYLVGLIGMDVIASFTSFMNE